MTTATGRPERRGDTDWIVFSRTFRAPIEDVWAAVTEPERMARWIGTWHGDPATGRVRFRMTAEENAPEEVHHIEVCDPPRHLITRSVGEGPDGRQHEWRVELRLRQEGDVTTLLFGQVLPEPAWASHIGPGWDYYLDRLVAAENGGDVAAVDWEREYYPRLVPSYERLFPAGS